MSGGEDGLYRAVILDHSRNPRGVGAPAGATCRAVADNPFCGDRFAVAVSVAADAEARITDVGFEGAGCAISTASASMMTAAVRGRTRVEANALYRHFDRLVSGAPADEAEEAAAARRDGGTFDLTAFDLTAFGGVARFPVRAKCARLPWQALLAALAQSPSQAP